MEWRTGRTRTAWGELKDKQASKQDWYGLTHIDYWNHSLSKTLSGQTGQLNLQFVFVLELFSWESLFGILKQTYSYSKLNNLHIAVAHHPSHYFRNHHLPRQLPLSEPRKYLWQNRVLAFPSSLVRDLIRSPSNVLNWLVKLWWARMKVIGRKV